MAHDNNPWEKKGTSTAVSNPFIQASVSPKSSGGSDLNLMRILRVWPLAILGALLGLGIAWIMLRYAVPVYQASMRISMKEDISATAAMPTTTFNIRDPFNDKVDMIKSPTVSRLVVEDLQLHYTAISKGQLKNKDLYHTLAWRAWNKSGEPGPFSFVIHMAGSPKLFSWSRGNSSGKAQWNQPFLMGEDSVVVFTNARFDADAEIICTKQDVWSAARVVAAGIKLGTQPQSFTMDVSYADEVPSRAVDILSKLADAYDKSTIEYKNKSLKQSIHFIQERLLPLASELDSLETEIARFKTSKKITSSGTGASSGYLTKSETLDRELSVVNMQHQTLDLVQRYINNPRTKDENLSLVGLTDSYLQGLVMNYQLVRQERDKIAEVTTTDNPNRISIELQLDKAKNNIDVQINNYRTLLNLKQRDVTTQLGQVNALYENAPIDEKRLLEKQRQQNIKQSLYLLLFQRKEEAAISLASTTSETRVLSPSSYSGPISPKSGQLYAIGLALGLLIPIAIAFIKELMNHSITSKKQLQSLISAPILGTIDLAENAADKLYVVGQEDRSAVAEQVRAIRTNLRFYTPPHQPLYVLLTSSFSGEGKTFVSGNLAKTFALQDLRVALLEFDMRKPKLTKKLGLSPQFGLSSALMGQSKFEDIIIVDKDSPKLHLFPTGIIPPNPSELMSNKYMDALKVFLDANYDVIIIDTPPIGLVSDAQLLTPWANVTLMVVRFGLTPKQEVIELEELNKTGTLGNLAIIFNGVKTSGYYGYKYSPYYYKNKYGNEYYQSNKKKKKQNFFSKIFSKQ